MIAAGNVEEEEEDTRAAVVSCWWSMWESVHGTVGRGRSLVILRLVFGTVLLMVEVVGVPLVATVRYFGSGGGNVACDNDAVAVDAVRL